MTQPSLLDLTQEADSASNREAVRRLLLRHPNELVSALEIARVGGSLSSRTRISELRKARYGGMQIENVQQRVGRSVHSYYRYVANR